MLSLTGVSRIAKCVAQMHAMVIVVTPLVDHTLQATEHASVFLPAGMPACLPRLVVAVAVCPAPALQRVTAQWALLCDSVLDYPLLPTLLSPGFLPPWLAVIPSDTPFVSEPRAA